MELDHTYNLFGGFLAIAIGFVLVLLFAGNRRELATVLLVAYAFRAACVVIHHLWVPLPGSDMDMINFEGTAAAWAAGGFYSLREEFNVGAYLLSWLVAVFYAAVGRSPMAVQAMMAVLGTSVVALSYRVGASLWGRSTAIKTAWVVALFPTLVLYSALIMRECVIAFLSMLCVLLWVRWAQRRNVIDFILAIVCACGATAFHSGMFFMIPVLVAGAVIVSLSARALTSPAGLLSMFVSVILGASGLYAITASGWGLEYFGESITAVDFEEIERRQQIATGGESAYLEGFTISNPVDLLWKGPVRLTYFLLSPFPWMIRSPGQAIGLADALLFTGAAWLIFRSRKSLLRNRPALVLLGVALTVFFVFSVGTSNFGTAIRHRSKLAPLVFALIARYPLERRKPQRPRRVSHPPNREAATADAAAQA
jgi:hypothetical protein